MDDTPAKGLTVRYYANFLVSLRVLIGVLMLSAIAINFANVIARRIFAAPFIWAEEVLVYIVVWMVFIGSVLVSWNDSHLRMDLVSSNLKGRTGIAVNGLAMLIALGLSVFVVAHSYLVIMILVRTGQQSIAAGIPLYVPHMAVPAGFLLIFAGTVIGAKRTLARAAEVKSSNTSATADN